MKKKNEKKLHLGKIKIANLNNAKPAHRVNYILSTACSIVGCDSPSQGAHICSDDSCRF